MRSVETATSWRPSSSISSTAEVCWVSPGCPLASISGVVSTRRSRGGGRGLARLSVGQHLRCGQQAVLALEGRQPLLILIHPGLRLLELALQPRRGLSGGLHPHIAFLLAIGANQGVYHAGRQGRVPASRSEERRVG